MASGPEALTVDGLAGVRAGFFTRAGGVSDGLYASLNCGFGSGDDGDKVATNRARASETLGGEARGLVTAYQVHGTAVAVVERAWAPGEAPRADALVSRVPGMTLGILTADCAPVLLADTGAGIVGAAHAGWRGALAGVVEETVTAMVALGARPGRIAAAIGPCIAQDSYEVGPELHQAYLDRDAANGSFFKSSPRDGHRMFDLAGYVARRLERLGLASVETLGRDSCADEAAFFSYRRATLRGEGDYGRNLAAIALVG